MSNIVRMKHWIGVDVSKTTLDFAITGMNGEHIESLVIANTLVAIRKLIRCWTKVYSIDKVQCLICLEATGRYSDLAVKTFVELGYHTWLAHPMDIQKSIGIVRGKNDRIDAIRIAEYARRFCDKAKLVTEEQLATTALKQLLSKRIQLVRRRAMLKTQIKESNKLVAKSLQRSFDKMDQLQIRSLEKAISEIERLIEAEINAKEKLSRDYQLLLTIDGIGPVLATHLLAITCGLARFTTPRQLACHAGVAPFEFSSGSSIRGRTKTSPLAQRMLKSLLHMSALGLVRRPGEIQDYWIRKQKEGKPKMAILNSIRNKLIHRAFAVLKRGTPFQKEYLAVS